MQYEFRLATTEDVLPVVEFLNTHWGQPHPLVNNPDLRSYYYEQDKEFNFCLCLAEGRIVSAAGFIYTSKRRDAIFVSIWCADKTAKGAGLELMECMGRLTGASLVCCNNIRPKTAAFYEFLGYKTGRFTHAYILAPRECYEMAQPAGEIAFAPTAVQFSLRPLDNLHDIDVAEITKDVMPHKDAHYLQHRYIDYPFWSSGYKLYALTDGQEVKGILVTRQARCYDSCALRLTDFIGDPSQLAHVGQAVMNLLLEQGAEYADIYAAGVADTTLESAGFTIRTPDDDTVIPNYTDPPLQKSNTDFYYFTSGDSRFVMYRSDGDGDRPPMD